MSAEQIPMFEEQEKAAQEQAAEKEPPKEKSPDLTYEEKLAKIRERNKNKPTKIYENKDPYAR